MSIASNIHFLPLSNTQRSGLYKCQEIWERGRCNLVLDVFWCVFSACHSRQRRSDWHDKGKCLRQVSINTLRQDTEILPLSVSLGAFQCTPCFFILYPFSNFLLSLCSTPLPPFNPSYYWHYLRCLLQKAGHSKHPGSTGSKPSSNTEFWLKMNT